ncbi:hypothetical protein [Streptococcus pantholopis]|uniref:hypothetical protein n=1 Tax=Streptococcus pantholopis TaxID=1811193 RepID=UPI000B0E8A9C|nr:hypothetical protein [Streptococcus pantholopis]
MHLILSYLKEIWISQYFSGEKGWTALHISVRIMVVLVKKAQKTANPLGRSSYD